MILESAERQGQELPQSAVHRVLLEKAETLGFGTLDHCAVMKAWRGRLT